MRLGYVYLKWYEIALLCGPVFIASNGALAEVEPPSEHIYLQDFPVVLSASRLLQPLSETPNAMTVIDSQMIKASGFRRIADLFRLVPGMYVGYAGANSPFVSLNSVSDQYSRRMQVLIDGRSVYLPPFGGVDWQGLPLLIEDIERIEVVRGPAAASHGSNSFYGVINIITRDAASDKAKSVGVSKGGMGVSDVSAHLGMAGEAFDYRLAFGYLADGGDNPQVLNDSSSHRLLDLRTNYRTDSENSFELQLGLNDGVSGQGTAGRDKDPFRDVQTRNDFQQLSWLHVWGGGEESKLTYYRIARDYTDPYKCIDYATCGSPTPLTYTKDEARSQRQELEIQNTTQLGANNRAVWGGGIRNDYMNQPLLFTTPITLHQSRVFAHDEWRVTRSMLVNMGAMYENDGVGHKNTSPRISINYHLDPQQTLRASISSATRNPVMVEMFMKTNYAGYWNLGNTPPVQDIKPEKILAREIGYVGQFGSASVDGRIYYDKVRDIILVDYLADLSHMANSFKNMSEATSKGLDISVNYRWKEGGATVNYSRQQTSCSFSAYPTQYFNPTFIPGSSPPATIGQTYQTEYLDICAESVPSNSGSVLLSQQLTEKMQFSIGYYLRSKVRVSDVSPSLPPESQMRRVDIRIAGKFGPKEKPGGGEMAVVLQNAFQDNYTGYGNLQQTVNLLFKRRAYFTATLYF
jgi:iron complex outermembrane recepter protein